MRQLTNITDTNFQKHLILFEESEITLHLRFYSIVQAWFFDVEYKDFKVFGKKMSVSTYQLIANNQPFDLVAFDTSQNGLDPFKADDFSSGRVALILLEPDDMEAIRGTKVPI